MILRTNWIIKKKIYKLDTIINLATGELIDPEFILKEKNNYVDSLTKLGLYLIKKLINLKFKISENSFNMENNSFFYSLSHSTLHFLIIKTNSEYYYFYDFKTKFGVDMPEDINSIYKIINFSNSNHLDSYSLASDSFNLFLNTILFPKKSGANRKIYRKFYPIIENSTLLRTKNYTSGFQFFQEGEYNNVYNYDQSSAYPAELLNNTPIGEPLKLKKFEDIKINDWFCVRIYLKNVKLKYGFDWLKLIPNQKYIYLTKELYKLFQETYTGDYKISDFVAFKTTQHQFDKFIKKTIIDAKIVTRDVYIKKYTKLLANSLIGYFGRNIDSESYTINYINNKYEIEHLKKHRDPIYLPIYLCIQGRQKAKFLYLLNKYKNDIVYANTDGFISTKKLNIDNLNINFSSNIGKYRLDKEFKNIYIKNLNCYSAITIKNDIENILSGIPATKLIKPSELKNVKYKIPQRYEYITDDLEVKIEYIN